MANPALLSILARCFASGEPTADGIAARTAQALGRPWFWLLPLARRYLKAHGALTRPKRQEVIRFLLDDTGFRHRAHKLSVAKWLTEPQRMQPVQAAAEWNLPELVTEGDLASWLSVRPEELDWFADPKGLNARTSRPPLEHYHYRVLAKRRGGIRLIEAPKPRLKEMQRQILGEILDLVPAHPAAHGFCPGRSIRTFAEPHVGRPVVLRMDLQDFFPSLPAARIQAVFRTLGYPELVADLLAGVCTNRTHSSVLRTPRPAIPQVELIEARRLYHWPHLPQGAPTSPALANLCAYRADCRLTGLARNFGAIYTRYADDLAFSFGQPSDVRRFSTYAAAILLEEGFAVNHRKTRIMTRGMQQRLAGLVTNDHLNIPRSDFDTLKAILTNCVRLGPATQNRAGVPDFRAHLNGRVGFVESIHTGKGSRLRAIFDNISW
ncbi:reverse transcriptase family protein [Paludibaculum fermentans]|uniref:RNA-directed DNA polymerase n=1 Tax=Paludibaculum fermentans TaxID=1473598 RepID=A0A7S7NNL2_PALFE|nr:reverse transcriptase family protein [Paludibaculum fermentans]QOY86896.1 RNA-directed DNA polymerase [Paludibaculum fermentans]